MLTSTARGSVQQLVALTTSAPVVDPRQMPCGALLLQAEVGTGYHIPGYPALPGWNTRLKSDRVRISSRVPGNPGTRE